MGILIVSLLLLASVPALMPRWRDVIFSVGVLIATSVAAMLYLLRDLDAHPGAGDGPAFAALIILFGTAQLVIVASLLGRVIAQYVSRVLSPSTRARVIRVLVVISLLPLALAVVLVIQHMATTMLVAFAAVLFFPLFWFALALQLADKFNRQVRLTQVSE